MTEEDVRRIVREELAKQALQPIDYRGHSPRMACACGPGQCARTNTTAGPCEHMRYHLSWP